MIAIIDYGAGNIQSVSKALKHIGCKCLVTNDKEKILNADGAVLPGVGSFGHAVNNLEQFGVKNAVKKYIDSGKPFLGICLGMQLLFSHSQESPQAQGLGIFEGKIMRIPDRFGLKIPHMGWNNLTVNPASRLFKGIDKNLYVYFVHSYYLNATDKNLVSATTEYGVQIDAAIEQNNVFATQFHPEKSGETGLQILKNFAAIVEG